MDLAEVSHFLDRYQDAFGRLDGDAVAALWHDAGSGIADSRGGCGRLTWWADAASMRANHIALCQAYREAGFDHARWRIEHHVPMGPDHAFVDVRWTLHAADGRELQRFGTGYQLMRGAGGPCVLLCTAYQEDLQSLRTATA